MIQSLSEITRLKTWVTEKALPFWANASVDPKGGFYEKLNPDGSPIIDCPRRVRVQARQTYVYTYADYLGWFPGAKNISDRGWEFLNTKGMQGGAGSFQGIAHLLNPDGSLSDGYRDTYAQSFLLLVAAWRVRVYDDDQAKEVIEQTCRFLNSEMRAANGGWHEGVPPSQPRRQNPHMHLMEAFMACYEATGRQLYLKLASDVYDLFCKHFYDEKNGVLLEFFNSDWSPANETGHLIVPGHMMEWCWLLRNYEKLTGTDTAEYAANLYSNALRLGLNQKTGLLFDEVMIDGGLIQATSRLWTSTEYLKASAAQSEAGRTGMAANIESVIRRMFQIYLDTPTGNGWHDKCAADGKILPGYWETSTFYHLISMVGVLSEMETKVTKTLNP